MDLKTTVGRHYQVLVSHHVTCYEKLTLGDTRFSSDINIPFWALGSICLEKGLANIMNKQTWG